MEHNARENQTTSCNDARENATFYGNEIRENCTTTETAVAIGRTVFGLHFVFFLALMILHKRKRKKEGQSVGFHFP